MGDPYDPPPASSSQMVRRVAHNAVDHELRRASPPRVVRAYAALLDRIANRNDPLHCGHRAAARIVAHAWRLGHCDGLAYLTRTGLTPAAVLDVSVILWDAPDGTGDG